MNTTKTLTLEIDAYHMLRRERLPRESFSSVVRRIMQERPALTAGELEEAMKAFEGKGAGPRRVKRRVAA